MVSSCQRSPQTPIYMPIAKCYRWILFRPYTVYLWTDISCTFICTRRRGIGYPYSTAEILTMNKKKTCIYILAALRQENISLYSSKVISDLPEISYKLWSAKYCKFQISSQKRLPKVFILGITTLSTITAKTSPSSIKNLYPLIIKTPSIYLALPVEVLYKNI